jgi:microtubule-associated protein 1
MVGFIKEGDFMGSSNRIARVLALGVCMSFIFGLMPQILRATMSDSEKRAAASMAKALKKRKEKRTKEEKEITELKEKLKKEKKRSKKLEKGKEHGRGMDSDARIDVEQERAIGKIELKLEKLKEELKDLKKEVKDLKKDVKKITAFIGKLKKAAKLKKLSKSQRAGVAKLKLQSSKVKLEKTVPKRRLEDQERQSMGQAVEKKEIPVSHEAQAQEA